MSWRKVVVVVVVLVVVVLLIEAGAEGEIITAESWSIVAELW